MGANFREKSKVAFRINFVVLISVTAGQGISGIARTPTLLGADRANR